MTHSKSSRLLLRALAIAIVSTLLAWGVMHIRAARDIEEMTFDIRVLAFAPETHASDKVVMVWLDEETMRALPYRSPIPRDFLAKLHLKILKAEPWLVAYDIFFKDPSFPNADREFIDALEEGAAYAIVPRRSDGKVDMPLPEFNEALTGVGLADLPFNPFDATVRKARFSFDTDRGPMDSYAAMIFRGASGIDAATSIREQAKAPGFGPISATPYVGDDDVYIRFAGPPGMIGGERNAFKIYSAKLVEKGLVPEAWLKDKIVLVGASYEDLKDAFLTPYYARVTDYARMTGTEIHANIVSSLLTNQFYFVLRPWQAVAWTFMMALVISIAVVLVSPWRSAVVFVLTIAASMAAAVWAFRSGATVFPVVSPIAGGLISFGTGLGWRALAEGRQKRFIKGVFARYVPAAVVERMTENPALLKLGGETRTVTSLFTDIASFTSISERMDPETLVKFLNDYLGRMNEVLFRNGATLDKYEGDAIIAFFNAPLDVAEHELAAARSALGIKRASREISEGWREQCGREIVTRAGINTGKAVVGNMGSEGRFDYTAIGDTINLASRLEGANKFFDTVIMASEATVAKIDLDVIVRPLDRVRVKGKAEPITLYEIVGEKVDLKDETELLKALIEPYKEAFSLLQSRRVDEAKIVLYEIRKKFPDDGPTREMINRCDRAITEPDWDLVTDLLSK
jgi:adenylate cyclase